MKMVFLREIMMGYKIMKNNEKMQKIWENLILQLLEIAELMPSDPELCLALANIHLAMGNFSKRMIQLTELN